MTRRVIGRGHDRRVAAVCAAAAVATVLLAPAPQAAGEPRRHGRAAAPAMQVYVGTTHAHTGTDNTHGDRVSTAEDVLDAAAETGFDFFMLTEHSGPTGPSYPAAFYESAQQAAAERTDAGFVGLVGYEYSDNEEDGDDDEGHLTAFGTDTMVDALAPAWNFATFFSHLVEQDVDRTVIAGFNHPPASGHPASRAAYLTPATRRLTAFSETYNKSEYRRRAETRYYNALIAELDRGWRVAPTCGLDFHSAPKLRIPEAGDETPCRTGLLAPSLTRDDVLEAMLARRIFATRDPDLRVTYTANDRWMGSGLGAPRRVRFVIRASDPDTGRPADRIRRVDVVGTGGRVLDSHRFSAHRAVWRPDVPARRNTYMLVRVFTRDHATATALAAPVWMSGR